MANVAFVVSLVLFHLLLFTSFALYAREKRREGHAALGIALAFLAYVAYDLVRDPARERLGGLSMGLSFMFALLWVGAAILYSRIAAAGGVVPRSLSWLTKRSGYWVTSGSVGAIAFGVAFPRLRGFEGASLGPGASDAIALLGLTLAIVSLLLSFLRVRSQVPTIVAGDAEDAARQRAATRAAVATWGSLALGLSGVVLLVLSGFP